MNIVISPKLDYKLQYKRISFTLYIIRKFLLVQRYEKKDI